MTPAAPDAVRVKICGVRDLATAQAAAAAGAAYLGFMFFPRSPRHLGWDEAHALMAATPPGVAKVAVTVDPDDAAVERLAALPLDMLQLHGAETPDRVAALRAAVGAPVMKTIGVRVAEDLEAAARYAPVVDQLLVEGKPPKDSPLPGGVGATFDWSLIAGRRWPVPWMLAGGLTADNVGRAVALTGARQVDVSSGVEASPGVKDAARIAAFLAAASAPVIPAL